MCSNALLVAVFVMDRYNNTQIKYGCMSKASGQTQTMSHLCSNPLALSLVVAADVTWPQLKC